VTQADVDEVIEARVGEEARRMAIALRSIFRTLKRSKTIFRDPTRGIVVPHGPSLPPRTLPDDLISGLLNRASDAGDRLAVALVAIHAVGQRELARIRLDDPRSARAASRSAATTGQERYTSMKSLSPLLTSTCASGTHVGLPRRTRICSSANRRRPRPRPSTHSFCG
jgi:hypothetical protein